MSRRRYECINEDNKRLEHSIETINNVGTNANEDTMKHKMVLRVFEYCNMFISMFGIYFLWIISHYICSHLYIHVCVPATIFGFISSPFVATAPHCQALRWVIYQGGNSIIAMWFVTVTWVVRYYMIPIKSA